MLKKMTWSSLAVAIASLTMSTIAPGVAGASTGLAGAGGGINLFYAPPSVQSCFGTNGLLYFDGNGTEHVNGTGAGKAHWSGTQSVVVSVVPDGAGTAPSYTGTGVVTWDAWIPVDPVVGGGIRTPLHMDLVSADGTSVIHAAFNFAEMVFPVGGKPSDVAYGLLWLPDYSDYSCTAN
ncbi:MAG: hypothetical protein JO087_13120 [Actinobacteria bacterium]|nr:hypothetical protein [Actinomycetota bacterium]